MALQIPEADAFQLLDLVVTFVVSSNSLTRRLPVAGKLAAWFSNEQHSPILQALTRIHTDHLKMFAEKWTVLACALLRRTDDSFDDGRSQHPVTASRRIPRNPIAPQRFRVISCLRYSSGSTISEDSWSSNVYWILSLALGLANQHEGETILRLVARASVFQDRWSWSHSRSSLFVEAILYQQLWAVEIFLKQLLPPPEISGPVSTFLGAALFAWCMKGAGEGTAAVIVELLIRWEDTNPMQPCWECYSPAEIGAMAGTDTGDRFLRQLSKSRAGVNTDGPIMRIAEAARRADGDDLLENMLSTRQVSPHHLELALAGASILGFIDLVRFLFRNGTPPGIIISGIDHLPSLGNLWKEGRCANERQHNTDEMATHAQILAMHVEYGTELTPNLLRALSVSSCPQLVKQSVQLRVLNSPVEHAAIGAELLDLAVLWEDVHFFEALLECGIGHLDYNRSLNIALGISSIETVRAFWQKGARPSMRADGQVCIRAAWYNLQRQEAEWWFAPNRDIIAKIQFLLDRGAQPDLDDLSDFASIQPPGSDLENGLTLLCRARPNLGDDSDSEASATDWELLAAVLARRLDKLEHLLNAGARIPSGQNFDSFISVVKNLAFLQLDGDSEVASSVITALLGACDTQHSGGAKLAGTALTIASLLGDHPLIAAAIEVSQARSFDLAKYATEALSSAAARGHVEIALELLKQSADVDGGIKCRDILCRDWKCATPMCQAARDGHLDMVRLLVNAGAEGFQPRCDAAFGRDVSLGELGDASVEEMPKLLATLQGGEAANSKQPNIGGRTKRFGRVIAWAQRHSQPTIADMLRRYQALDKPMTGEDEALYARSCPFRLATERRRLEEL